MHKVERVTRAEAAKIAVDSLAWKIDAYRQQGFQPEDGVVEIAMPISPLKAAFRGKLPAEEIPDHFQGLAQSVTRPAHPPAHVVSDRHIL